ncbi:hypothetical protein CYLTODRAFT_444190 [Cylindrobasidium torrendii FP15055 ss-10]|uniref:Uncharacterized protein n=1 Tax=Cylindrobasidium torrendii FP15055 ss-10 TaxID=1314674 RepID=A0A0D7BAN9_9AGAR|nr:hypothetical protein CYLTODRAFT_444190 [Cylindrobasidium torrendii FP15055 ss-10]
MDRQASGSALSPRMSMRGSRLAPMGPRLRQSSAMMALDSESGPSRASGMHSPRSSNFSDDSRGTPPMSPNDPGISPPQEVSALPAIGDLPAASPASSLRTFLPPPPPPPLSEPIMNIITEEDNHDPPPDIDAPSYAPPSTPTSRTAPPISASPPRTVFTPSPTPSRASPKAAPVSLPSAPPVTFESASVQWKGLPLEAALWTLESHELQNIVSRAIRSSAQESFIRLLSVENLDTVLPAELERLDTAKMVAQSQYRFNVHRRTMLLQALVSLSSVGADKEKDGGGTLIAGLAKQLAEVTAACDSLTEQLVTISDQVRQIQRLLDVHWGSALAIALRKLNGSYGKRTAELRDAKGRIGHLEAELSDAWKEAEKLAREIDELEEDDDTDFDPEEETGIIGTAQIVSLPSPTAQVTNIPGRQRLQHLSHIDTENPGPPPQSPLPLSPLMISPAAPKMPFSLTPPPLQSRFRRRNPVDVPQPIEACESSEGEEADEQAIASEIPAAEALVGEPDVVAFPVEQPQSNVGEEAESDRVSLRSNKSAKSTKSQRGERRVDMVSAARRRSLRRTEGSLRLPWRVNTAHIEHPPVPDIPQEFSPATARPPSNDSHEPIVFQQPRHPRSTLDDIEIVPREPAELREGNTTTDDMYIMPLRDNEMKPGQKKMARRSADNIFATGAGFMGVPRTGQSSIPSIWKNTDTPQTPAERVASMGQSRLTDKGGSLGKFKSLSKRYSLPLNALARTFSTRSSGSR